MTSNEPSLNRPAWGRTYADAVQIKATSPVVSTRTNEHGYTFNLHACGAETVIGPNGLDTHDWYCFSCAAEATNG